jgi:uncharacterized membrane protein YozB (DUF420 family)
MNANVLKKKVILPVLYFLALLFTLYIVIQYVIYKPSQAGVVSSKLQDPNFPYAIWKIFFFPHVILGTIALLVGGFQLSMKSRRNRQLHRPLGRIYAFSIFFNVLAVPYIALYATGGTLSTIAFLVADVLWLVTTLMAVVNIRRKKIAKHRAWMLRSYSVTFLFVTFRIFALTIHLTTHASLAISFPIAVYFSLFVNLLITELYLRKRRKESSTLKTKTA